MGRKRYPDNENDDPGKRALLPRCSGRLIGAVGAVLMMLALKWGYSLAGPGDLAWILAPTARALAWLSPAHPVWEQGCGYVDFSQGIIIAPACAGLNFMIMAFALAALCGIRQMRRPGPILMWLALSLALAYVLAVGVNAVRIALSIRLYRAAIYSGWVTPERVHRLAGVGVYLLALGLFFRGLRPIMLAYSRRFEPLGRPAGAAWPSWLPLGCYLAGAVGVPTIHLLCAPPAAGYAEHCITVTLAALVLWAGGVSLGSSTHANKDTHRRG
jgi:exosortase K